MTRTVTLTLDADEAEALSGGLSDLLCIIRGISIAKPKIANEFMGVESVRTLNIKLKQAMDKAQ